MDLQVDGADREMEHDGRHAVSIAGYDDQAEWNGAISFWTSSDCICPVCFDEYDFRYLF